jgi:hypothetical protein
MDSFRSAGGHWHVGYKDETKEMLEDPYGKAEVIKMLDIFQGVPSILLDRDETAPLRRSLYGKAGAHRPKPYGVEYRALGNFWVTSPTLVDLMYRLSDVAVRLCGEGESETIVKEVDPKRVIQAINTSDVSLAKDIVETVLRKYLEKDLFANILTEVPSLDLYKTWQLAA